jgi:hypothetical protein
MPCSHCVDGRCSGQCERDEKASHAEKKKKKTKRKDKKHKKKR